MDKEEDFFRRLVHMWIKQAAVQVIGKSKKLGGVVGFPQAQGPASTRNSLSRISRLKPFTDTAPLSYTFLIFDKFSPAIPIPPDSFRNLVIKHAILQRRRFGDGNKEQK
ncbi:hypothetical protein G159_19555 [Planococcus glaciei CHR43]|nr:hypothetical protein G159_19555 [Planococcus glaciei CHR43]